MSQAGVTTPTSTDRASTSPGGRKDRPRGSHLSDRQIAQAALRGRRVTVRWFGTQPAHEVVGYVTGMDDYHWMISTVVAPEKRENSGEPVVNVLVHKARADIIALSPESTLETEEPLVLEALVRIGGAFWRHCESNYTGR